MSGDEVRIVVRPSVPPVAWAVAGLWVGVLSAEAVSWRMWCGLRPGWSALQAAGIVAVVASVAGLLRRHWAALVCAGLAVGLVCGTMYWSAWRADAVAFSRRGSLTGVVVADAREGEFGTRVPLRAESSSGRPIRIEVTVPRDAPAPEMGERVTVLGSARAVGRDEWGRLSHQRGEAGRFTARIVRSEEWSPGLRGLTGRLRVWAGRRIAAASGPGAGLVAAVTLGDRRGLRGTAAEEDFRATGLSHLVAVSGSHLAMVAMLVAAALRRAGATRGPTVLVTLLLTGAYVILTGCQASALRAWGMVLAAGVAGGWGRRGDGLAGLACAVGVGVVANPATVFDVGFRLSVIAVAGLVTFARLAEGWVAGALPGWMRAGAPAFSLTLVAQVATLPVAVPSFGVVSLVGPFTNPLCVPLVTVALVTALVGCVVSSIAQAPGALMLAVAGLAGDAVVRVAGVAARLPYACVPLDVAGWVPAVLLGVAGAAIWARWPQPSVAGSRLLLAGSLAALLALAAGPRPPRGMGLTVLDVGQGDAVLLRDGPRELLVDAGPSQASMTQALRRARVRDVDTLVLTHAHDDHTGGARAFTRARTVGRVMVPAAREAGGFDNAMGDLDAPVVPTTRPDRVAVGRLSVEVLSPELPVADVAENASSVVMLVRAGEGTVLLTGDAEADVLRRLTSTGRLGDIDVLKVGHHGSEGAVSPEVLSVLRPEYAIISVGEANRFGHPRQETLDLLGRWGCTVLRTDLHGDVEVEFISGGVVVRAGGRTWSPGTGAAASSGDTTGACATLAADTENRRENPTREHTERPTQARLPHPERAIPAGRAGAQPHAQAIRGTGRRRLRRRHVRRRERLRRRHRRVREHPAVHQRPPPRRRAKRRQAEQGGSRRARGVRSRSGTHDRAGAVRQEAREEHAALQGRRQVGRRG